MLVKTTRLEQGNFLRFLVTTTFAPFHGALLRIDAQSSALNPCKETKRSRTEEVVCLTVYGDFAWSFDLQY